MCPVTKGGHCDLDLDLWPTSKENFVRVVYPTLTVTGTSYLGYGFTLGRRCVMYQKEVTVTLTLTSDPHQRKTLSGLYLLHYFSLELHALVIGSHQEGGVSCTKIGHCDLDFDL